MKKRFCAPCDDVTNGNPCPACGADTVPWPVDGSPTDRWYQENPAASRKTATANEVKR
jgi:hypothetical protein